MSDPQLDVIIAGGGLVGASLACVLGGAGLRVCVVEAVPLSAAAQPSFDDRAIVLDPGSRLLFQAVGLWPRIAPEATPIRRVHVSQQGRFGFTHMDAREEDFPALGYVVPARTLGGVLAARLGELPGVDLRSPARVARVEIGERAAAVTLEAAHGPETLHARLLVGADGARSVVREALSIPATRWDYGQTAVVANVRAGHGHDGCAYERFTHDGPLALLPLSEDRCGVVWVRRPEDAGALLTLDEAGFLAALQAGFGRRLGRFRAVGARQAYPLSMVRAERAVQARVALIGNAAHTLHPVAAQGFNLGLRDVAALAEVIVDGGADGTDPGDPALLARYQHWRTADQRRAIAFTDGLIRLFRVPLPGGNLARGLAMTALDLLPPFKRRFIRAGMGRVGRLPRLCRGVPL